MNAPSVVIWELFDEGRGQFDTDSLCTYLDELDGTRLIDRPAAGSTRGMAYSKASTALARGSGSGPTARPGPSSVRLRRPGKPDGGPLLVG